MLDRQNEHTAITDFPRAGGLNEGLDRVFKDIVWNHQFDHDLGQQCDAVLSPAVDGLVALLAPVTPDFRHGHTGNTDLGQCILHFF